MIVRTEKFYKKKVWSSAPFVYKFIAVPTVVETYEVRRRIWWLLWIIPLYVQYKITRRNT